VRTIQWVWPLLQVISKISPAAQTGGAVQRSAVQCLTLRRWVCGLARGHAACVLGEEIFHGLALRQVCRTLPILRKRDITLEVQ
jgi:hypothetical protein